jgi:SAM-dependent methyltransferase
MAEVRVPQAPTESSRVARREWERAYGAHPELAGSNAWPDVADFLQHYPGARVYETGFGSGVNLLWARQNGWEIAGCEVAPTPFAIASRLLPGADLRRESVTECSAPDGHYDAVIDRAALTCLAPEDLNTALAHVHRILKPGGVFLFTPYGAQNEAPFPEQMPEPFTWDLDSARLLFSAAHWELLEAQDVFRMYRDGDQSWRLHTLNIVVRKASAR